MKKKLIILTFIAFAALCGFSQNCGYMGKRVLINADISFSPAWGNYSFMGEPKYYTFNYIFSPNIEVIAWKKGTAGVVGHFFKTQYEHEVVYNDELGNPTYTSLDGFDDLDVGGFGIFYKQYVGKAHAPFGLYFKFELDYFIYNYTPNEVASIDNILGCKIEFGKDWLLLNRLHLSLAGSLGSTFGGYKTALYGTDFSNTPFYQNAYQYSKTSWAKGKILGAYWLGIKVGIGILAF